MPPSSKTTTRNGQTMAEETIRLRRIIEPLAAEYFLKAKMPDGRPADAVARFHLGNGARLERINWLGDRSARAMRESAGLMVNYLYDLDEIEKNHEAYANHGEIAASSSAAPPAQGGDAPAPATLRPRPMRVRSFTIRDETPCPPSFMTSWRAVFAAAAKTFIETPDGQKLTYGDLDTGSARLAGVLARLGVEPGDRVAVQVEKSPQAVLLYLACLRAGAIFLPLNTAYTPAEIEYFLSDAGAAVFVCDPGQREKLLPAATRAGVRHVETLGARADGSLVDRAAAERAHFEDAQRGPDDLAAILYTSGTTGRSKGAMLTHDNLASNALTLVEYWRFTSEDVLIHALPIYHTHGLFVAINIAAHRRRHRCSSCRSSIPRRSWP